MCWWYSAAFLYLVSSQIVCGQFFTQTPGEENYGVLTRSISLDWRYKPLTQVTLRRWTLRRPNQPTPIVILSVQPKGQGNNISLFENINPLYKDRVTYSENQGDLTISNLKLEDEGTVTCQVQDENLTAFEDFTELKIFYPIEVTSLTQERTSLEHEEITLVCAVNSFPVATITWYKSDQALYNNSVYAINNMVSPNALPPRIESRLIIKNATRHQAGLYYCDASHHSGTVKRIKANTTIKILYPPVISSFPSAQVGEITGAKDVKFDCIVKSYPLSTITWYINGNVYATSDQSYDVHTTSVLDAQLNEMYVKSTFTIKEVTTDDFGTYKCEAVNTVEGLGEKKAEKTLTLIISHKPYYLEKPSSEVIVKENGNTTLNCTVQGFPPPTVWWSTNSSLSGNSYENSTRVVAEKSNTIVYAVLVLKDLRKEHYGMFTCFAVESDTVEQANAMVKISYAPNLSGLEKRVHVEEDEISSIECIINSFPMSAIQWFYSSNNESFLDKTASSSNELLASSHPYETKVSSKFNFQGGGIKRTEEGYYYCEATNTDGVQQLRTEVVVDWKPTINSLIGPTNVKLHERAEFSCMVESKTMPTVTWLRDSLLVPISEQYPQRIILSVESTYESFLTIENATTEDMGKYTCRAENMVVDTIKRAEKSRQMNVLYKPILTVNSTTQEVGLDTESLTLSCAAKSYPPVTQYRWTKDSQPQPNLYNQSTFLIAILNPASEGTYTCIPSNIEGDGEIVTHEVIVRSEPVFTEVPACTIVDTSTITCECAGRGFSKPTVHWTKNGSTVIQSNYSTLTLAIGGNATEAYACHLTNKDGKNLYVLQLQDFIPEMTLWSSWSDCNITCGQGYKYRNRSRNFISANVKSTDNEVRCSGTGCPQVLARADDWHRDWYIAFWVAIPLLAIMLIVCFLYVKRRNKKREKAVFVPTTRVLSTPSSIGGSLNSVVNGINGTPISEKRRMSAHRSIYLPSQVPMSALSHGYIPEKYEPDLPKKYETDTIEVEMQFQADEEAEDVVNITGDAEEKQHYNENDIKPEEDNFSFPGSTFNHLNSSSEGNDSFLSLYDKAGGPPKPPRVNDSSFTGGPSGISNLSFADENEGADVHI